MYATRRTRKQPSERTSCFRASNEPRTTNQETTNHEPQTANTNNATLVSTLGFYHHRDLSSLQSSSSKVALLLRQPCFRGVDAKRTANTKNKITNTMTTKPTAMKTPNGVNTATSRPKQIVLLSLAPNLHIQCYNAVDLRTVRTILKIARIIKLHHCPRRSLS